MIKALIDAALDSKWIEKAKWRVANEYWLMPSFKIAVDIIHQLSENEKNRVAPSTEDGLANMIGVSSKEMKHLLSGKANFDLKTICKIEIILGIKILK